MFLFQKLITVTTYFLLNISYFFLTVLSYTKPTSASRQSDTVPQERAHTTASAQLGDAVQQQRAHTSEQPSTTPKMVPPPLNQQEVNLRMQVIPTMEPRPNSTNINAFEDAMVDILSTIPSAQNKDWGFQGLIQSAEIYALSTNMAWRNWPNPGPT